MITTPSRARVFWAVLFPTVLLMVHSCFWFGINRAWPLVVITYILWLSGGYFLADKSYDIKICKFVFLNINLIYLLILLLLLGMPANDGVDLATKSFFTIVAFPFIFIPVVIIGLFVPLYSLIYITISTPNYKYRFLTFGTGECPWVEDFILPDQRILLGFGWEFGQCIFLLDTNLSVSRSTIRGSDSFTIGSHPPVVPQAFGSMEESKKYTKRTKDGWAHKIGKNYPNNPEIPQKLVKKFGHFLSCPDKTYSGKLVTDTINNPQI